MHRQSRPKLLITRPAAQTQDFADAIAAAYPDRWDIVIHPLIDITFRRATPDLTGVAALIFTSSNAVHAFAANSRRRDIPAICAGMAAQKAAIGVGLTSEYRAKTARGLLASLTENPAAGPLLHIAGQHRAVDLAGELTRANIPAHTQILYNQTILPLRPNVHTDLMSGAYEAVIMMSPRTAQAFCMGLAGTTLPAGLRLVCISTAAAQPLASLPCQIQIAKTPDAPAIIEML